jgi:hypothetical protein
MKRPVLSRFPAKRFLPEASGAVFPVFLILAALFISGCFSPLSGGSGEIGLRFGAADPARTAAASGTGTGGDFAGGKAGGKGGDKRGGPAHKGNGKQFMHDTLLAVESAMTTGY